MTRRTTWSTRKAQLRRRETKPMARCRSRADTVRDMTPAIEAIDLVKRFGGTAVDRPAVDGVSFAVPPGTVLGLLGPNGAGKTTTVRMMTTLTEPTSGTARVAGYDVRTRAGQGAPQHGPDRPGRHRRRIAHRPGEHPDDRRPVRHPAQGPGAAGRPTAGTVFDRRRRRPRRSSPYSGGMRRRLDLAVSLLASPPVLFLDEPTTGLDPRSRSDLWDVLRGLVEQGTTLLLTTQYLEEADQLADNIVVIDKGRIIAEGTPLQLKQQAGNASLVVTVTNADDLPAAQALLAQDGRRGVRRRRCPAAHRGRRRPGRHGPRRGLAARQRHRRRRHRPVPAQPRRRVPVAHRAPHRRARR